jgi:hypothetical protein
MLEGLSQEKEERAEEPSRARYRTGLKGLVLMKTGLRSDREIAQALGGYAPITIQGIMSGRTYPSKIMQRQLCRLLGINHGELKRLL